jgi:ABC-type antimicrobial peptide transport system permease subunit
LSLDQRLQQHLSVERLLANLLLPIAVSGTLLAGFGVFAVVMHMVASRRREIAMRMVLGASPAMILYDTGRAGLGLALGGATFGCGGALAAEKLLAASTFDSRALDPAVLLSVTVVVLLTTLIAVWLPARRAARHDPAEALRAP